MKTLLRYLKNYKNLVFLALGLATINQMFSMMDPYIYGKIVDRFATKPHNYDNDAFVKGAGLLILAAIGVAMVSRIAKAFQDYTLNLIIQKFGAAVYTDGLKHALQLPFQDFEDQRSGELLNILQKVRTDSEKFIINFINIFFTSIVGIVFVIIYAIQVQPWLILAYFGASFLLAGLTSILSKKIKIVQQRIVAQTKALAGSTTESLRNIELIKSLGLTQQEMKRLNLSTQKILRLELEKVKDIRSISFLQGTIVNLLRQSILFLLLYMIFKDQMSLGQLMTLQFYSFFIFGPMQEMGNVIMSYREAEASLQNFEDIMSKPIEVKPSNPKRIREIENLEFNQVSFIHRTGKHYALNQISFHAKQGETIAFVGPSGSGKTTLVKLLVGLYHPLEGNVLYNGVPSQEIDFDELRNQIGFVTQDTQLFSGTIKENMLFVNPRATVAQITTALHQASCESLLTRSEKGIDSVIGEGGIKISGGEKQRLSIARALLREPRLLIFDEATSALDSITEEEIGNTIKEISAGKAHVTIMIAHRLSTIMHADRIYVLEKGELVETGRHEELISAKGLYYAMWRQQIGERN
ncbi:MAG: ABC transporter ATP-binding protein/permease [Bacteroidia bacterium]|nr:ABC transporter ATP-binding protein/permease [Bacteroidia bacterium]MCF8447452.1 ABC transporter ATP-binding protein/permease [Bacteroidia bacterium]